MEELGFCADLHRPLAQAKPLTAGPSELTYLEFGSPNATLFITKTENLGENPPSALKGAARCAGTPDWYDGPSGGVPARRGPNGREGWPFLVIPAGGHLSLSCGSSHYSRTYKPLI